MFVERKVDNFRHSCSKRANTFLLLKYSSFFQTKMPKSRKSYWHCRRVGNLDCRYASFVSFPHKLTSRAHVPTVAMYCTVIVGFSIVVLPVSVPLILFLLFHSVTVSSLFSVRQTTTGACVFFFQYKTIVLFISYAIASTYKIWTDGLIFSVRKKPHKRQVRTNECIFRSNYERDGNNVKRKWIDFWFCCCRRCFVKWMNVWTCDR